MTYAMDLLIHLNKNTPFKVIRCGYTYNGMQAVALDNRDGQEYKIEVVPNGVQLCPEAIDDIFNPEAMEVQGE